MVVSPEKLQAIRDGMWLVVNGDRGTLRFECHFVDLLTGKIAAVTGGNTDVARIDDRWLITNFVGSTAELKR